MSRNILKYITLLAMTLDHIAYYLYPELNGLYIISRFVGRIAFPIMCLFIVDGFRYTSSKSKYLLRLLICALITQIPICLLAGTCFVRLNAVFSLVLGFLFLMVINSKLSRWTKNFMFLLLLFTAMLTDYYFLGIIYILGFYYFKRNYQNTTIIMFAGYLILLLRLIITLSTVNLIIINGIINLGLFLTPLFVQSGYKYKKEGQLKKYLYYFYYPIHLFVIYLITLF